MQQILEINQALFDLLDYQKLKNNSEQILVSCAVNNNTDTIPTARIHNASGNTQKFTLYGITKNQTQIQKGSSDKFFFITSAEQNLLYVLGWLRNLICDKNYFENKIHHKDFWLRFNIYRYRDFMFINEITQNILLPREYLGLSELLLNMIEHDVFKDYESTKPVKFRSGTWLNNIEKHISIKPIELLIRFTKSKVIFNISHKATGFSQENLVSSENSPTGRGINLCKNLYFDTVDFFDHSRQIIATTYRV
jgi:hypothetical protein